MSEREITGIVIQGMQSGTGQSELEADLLPAVSLDWSPCSCCQELNMALTATGKDGSFVSIQIGPQALDHLIREASALRKRHRRSLGRGNQRIH